METDNSQLRQSFHTQFTFESVFNMITYLCIQKSHDLSFPLMVHVLVVCCAGYNLRKPTSLFLNRLELKDGINYWFSNIHYTPGTIGSDQKTQSILTTFDWTHHFLTIVLTC